MAATTGLCILACNDSLFKSKLPARFRLVAHRLQDVEVLVHMARRRCMDDKAAVRKAGLQLLEALLMMRARGAGGADVELPAEQDIRALEAATADALVRPAWLPCF